MMKGLVVVIGLLLGVAPLALAVDVAPPLRVDWTVTPSRTIEGRVYNEFHTYFTKIRLLVEARDQTDRVIGTKYGYVFGELAPRDSRYFDVRNVPAADHYRVVVETYVQEQFPNGKLGPR